MALPKESDLAKFNGWPSGANNVAREDSVPRASFREGINVDVLPGGKVRRRPGSTTLATDSGANFAWSDDHYALFVKNGTLKRFLPPGTFKTLLANAFQIDTPISYCSVNEFIYASDGIRAWRVSTIDDSVVPWGVPSPLDQPILTATSNGGMAAGRYQVAITYARADGEESGSPLAVFVYVVDGGGIAMSHFPLPPSDVTDVNVYMTRANGQSLLYYGNAPANATGIQLYNNELGKMIGTLLMTPLVPGTASCFTLGRLFVANGQYVHWSAALHYGLHAKDNDYIAYATNINMLAATAQGAQSKGIFVGCEHRTYFMYGTGPDSFSNVLAYTSGVVPGTLVYIPGSYFEIDGFPTEMLATWVAKNGTVCVGLPDGTVKPLTEGRFVMDVGDRGSAMFREYNGIRQAIFGMQGPTMASQLKASDSLIIETVHNGIAH